MQHAPRLPHVRPPPLTCSGWPRSSRELGLSGSKMPPMNSRKEGTKAKPSDRRQPQLSAWVTACPGTCQLSGLLWRQAFTSCIGAMAAEAGEAGPHRTR